MRIPPLASIAREDRPFYAFQKRLSAGELATPELNDQNRKLFGIPSQIVVREAFIADRESVTDSYQGETVRYWPLPEETLPRLAYRAKGKR